MKKFISTILVLILLVCSNASLFENNTKCIYPSSKRNEAIQKSNQRTERKGSTNGSLK